MTWGYMKVRNSCPFSVTFYALAGPTLEIPAFSTKTAKACLIWFSTRVKGGGTVINLDDWERYKEEYLKEYDKHAGQVGDPGGTETGTAAGSILGYGLDSLVEVFSVKNTINGVDTYFGAKKEGVYGNSDLVVYATLDPACKEDHEMGKIWMLHLENDNGQQSDDPNADPDYTVPDLSGYSSEIFFRLFNAARGSYLYAQYDNSTVSVHRRPKYLADISPIPFNPKEMREYWTLHPQDAGDNTHRVKLLNTSTDKWLTCFSTDNNRIGLYPINKQDYEDQHWDLDDLGSNGRYVQLKNAKVGQNLVGTEDDRVFLYNPIQDGNGDQSWIVETLTANISNIPKTREIYLMHAATGMILAHGDNNSVALKSEWSGGAVFNFSLENISGNTYKIRSTSYDESSVVLTYYQNENYLGVYPGNATDYQDQHWEIVEQKNHAGFYLRNQSPKWGNSNYLYYKNGGFGLFSGPYDNDQLWVALFK